MGFNYYRYGRIKPCGISSGKVYYTLPSGLRIEHGTRLKVEIPEQTNLFISDTVAFLLFDDDKMYIGRYDDSISIYRVSDGLLVGLNNWDAPKYADTKLCGFSRAGSYLNEIHLDMRDRRTLYICGVGSEGLFKNPVNSDFNISQSSFSASVFGGQSSYVILDERGDPLEAEFWPLQEKVRVQDCRVFL